MSENIQPGVGYTFTNAGKGSSLVIDSQLPYFAPTPLSCKLSVINNVATITITPGTVNYMIPKIGSQYIDTLPAPTLTATSSKYLILRVSRVAGEPYPTSAVFTLENSIPANTSSYAYICTGSLVKNGEDYELFNYAMSNLLCLRIASGDNSFYFWSDI